jgi:hypothetical protein
LLAERQAQRILAQDILHFIPEVRAAQALFHDLAQILIPVNPQDARAKGYIVIDGLRKGVGALKNHAHLAAQLDHIRARRIDIPVVQVDVAFGAHARDGVVHAIQATQKTRLAAAGRPDQRGDLPLLNAHADLGQSLFLFIVKT